jgi:hypothetical protein
MWFLHFEQARAFRAVTTELQQFSAGFPSKGLSPGDGRRPNKLQEWFPRSTLYLHVRDTEQKTQGGDGVVHRKRAAAVSLFY